MIGASGATAFPLERPPCYLANLYHVPDIFGHLLLNQCDDELINTLILSYVCIIFNLSYEDDKVKHTHFCFCGAAG